MDTPLDAEAPYRPSPSGSKGPPRSQLDLFAPRVPERERWRSLPQANRFLEALYDPAVEMADDGDRAAAYKDPFTAKLLGTEEVQPEKPEVTPDEEPRKNHFHRFQAQVGRALSRSRGFSGRRVALTALVGATVVTSALALRPSWGETLGSRPSASVAVHAGDNYQILRGALLAPAALIADELADNGPESPVLFGQLQAYRALLDQAYHTFDSPEDRLAVIAAGITYSTTFNDATPMAAWMFRLEVDEYANDVRAGYLKAIAHNYLAPLTEDDNPHIAALHRAQRDAALHDVRRGRNRVAMLDWSDDKAAALHDLTNVIEASTPPSSDPASIGFRRSLEAVRDRLGDPAHRPSNGEIPSAVATR